MDIRPSYGYVKDALAVVVFTVALITVTSLGRTIPLPLLQAFLVVGILVDGLFTLYPHLHNHPLF